MGGCAIVDDTKFYFFVDLDFSVWLFIFLVFYSQMYILKMHLIELRSKKKERYHL